jgi:hypothetical protein
LHILRRMRMESNSARTKGNVHAVASRLRSALDENSLPQAQAWDAATPIAFCADWQGGNADLQRQTEVRLLWSDGCLFIRYCARYRDIYVYPGPSCRRDRLWLRDVAEAFIRPEGDDLWHYREFEISPNGDWLDLDISPGRTAPLQCELRSRVIMDSIAHVWSAELAIPMGCFVRRLNPDSVWHVNFFRIEGPEPARFYSAWRPTNTPKPNFHVPEVFGELHFSWK